MEHIARFVYPQAEVVRRSDSERRGLVFHGHFVMVAELVDEATDFTRGAKAIRAGVVEEVHAAGPRDHTIEIVGKNTIAQLEGRQTEAVAKGVRDERRGGAARRKEALVHGEDDESVEVEYARFEHAHDLESGQRFAAEGDGYAFDKARQEAGVGIDRHGDLGLGDEVVHAR